MKKIKFIFIICFILSLMLTKESFATQLPETIVSKIKSTFPQARIRFDGLIQLQDGTKYIPVLPVNYAKVKDPSNIVQTIPAEKNFESKPDLIIFANNLSLLKLIKTPNYGYTLINDPNIPMSVKYGILPQDLVVPENFVVPEELKIILGDLKITTSDELKPPQKADNKKDENVSIKKTDYIKKKADVSLINLKNKTFYITTNQSNQVYAISADTGKLLNSIDTMSIPSSIALTEDNRYVLTADISTDSVSILDTANNTFVKKIDVGHFPSSIIIIPDSNKALVANKMSSSISVIDLLNMEKIEDITVKGYPTKLLLSEDSKSLFYVDECTGKIYKTELTGKKTLKLIAESTNISQIAQSQNILGILSRTENTLLIYDIEKNKLVKTITVGEKPIDIKILNNSNKIYVLSAETNSIDVIDLAKLEITGKIQLKGNAFPNKIVLFDSNTKAMITTADSYELPIVSIKDDDIIDYFPMTSPVNLLLIKDKQ